MTDSSVPVASTLAEIEAILKEANACAGCGFEVGTFACRIRHIHINTGWAKSAND